MEDITIVGVDLAKKVFQVHAANAEGRAIIKKRLPRTRFLAFMSAIPPCIVAMEPVPHRTIGRESCRRSVMKSA